MSLLLSSLMVLAFRKGVRPPRSSRRPRAGSARGRASGAKSSASVPVIQLWTPSATTSSNSAARRSASRWAAISSSSRSGARPRDSATSRAWASAIDTRTAFCWPVEPSAAGRSRSRWRTARSLRCGPQDVVPASASRKRLAASSERRRSSASSAGHGGEPAVDLARHGERRPREGADAQPCRRVEAMDGVGAGRGQRHAVAGHGVLERGEPVRIAAALGQQAGALAQRILVGRHVAGMLGMQRRHQPVEEAAPLARPVEEQPVELRRQPDGRDMQAERGLALGRPAVDAHGAARQAAVVLGRLQAGADGEPALRRVQRGGDRPGRGVRLAGAARRQTSSRRARRRPRPGARKDSASRRLVLPAPLAPTSTMGSGPQSRRSWR